MVQIDFLNNIDALNLKWIHSFTPVLSGALHKIHLQISCYMYVIEKSA